MPPFLRFLFDNPIVIFVLLAWLAGAIGNVVRAAKKRQEAAERARRMPQASPLREFQPRSGPTERSAEQIAAEMRRLLGMPEARPEPVDVDEARQRPARPARAAVEPERPPVPVVPTTQNRRLETHVDPHVGEGIAHRHSVQSGTVGRRDQVGTLGGRTPALRAPQVPQAPVRKRRYALADLKQAIVQSEILGPPLALRGPNELRGG